MKMKIRATAALAALGIALCTLAPMPARAAGYEPAVPAATGVGVEEFPAPGFDVNCRAAVLFEQSTGTILYEKNIDDRLAIASITKVMTLILTFEALAEGKIKYTDIVPISDHAFSMGGSQIWLEPGEQFTVEELIKAVVVSSANDAAVALAEMVGGSEPVFCEMMNQKAQELGMENTHFLNACGLDIEGHYSSARDVAIMSTELLGKHPEITQYTTIWMDYLRGGETQLLNTNKLLKSYAGITGLKTGTTGQAGVCISATATRENTSLVAVVLGAPSSEERFKAATALLDYGFANFEVAACPLPTGLPATLPVGRGAEKEVEISSGAPQQLLLRKGQGATLQAEAQLPEKLTAPVQAGSQVGTVQVKSGDTVVGTYPITAAKDVEKMHFKIALSLLTNSLFTM